MHILQVENLVVVPTYLVDTIKVISLILHPVVSFLYYINIQPPPQITTIQIYNNYIMQSDMSHSGQNCGAMIIVTRETGLITPSKKNIYNASFTIQASKVI